MDANKANSEFVLFDAMRVQKGPIARLRLKTPVHFGFHTEFYDLPL